MHADSSRDSEAIESLKLGLDLGMTHVDTAEMYGAGHSEEVVAKALEDWRKPVQKSHHRILPMKIFCGLRGRALTDYRESRWISTSFTGPIPVFHLPRR